MMEGQLARLSDIIRAREAEVAQLRLTVQAGCDERRELVAQIDQLSKVAAAGSSPGAAGGAAAAAADSKSPLVRSTVGGMPLRGAPPPQRQAPPLPAKGRFR